jgi:hypothetical protein
MTSMTYGRNVSARVGGLEGAQRTHLLDLLPVNRVSSDFGKVFELEL